MKRIKIASILLALFLVVLNSFPNPRKEFAQIYGPYRWFIYNGSGDPYNPSSYWLLAVEPECNGNGYLCAVLAELDFWTMRPKMDSLDDLGYSSSYFTMPYAGFYGMVKLNEY